VSLAGRLGEIDLAEILHFLSLNGRTGRLTLSRRDAHGTIVVRLGRIVYAASSSIRETLGSILVSRGRIGAEALTGALEAQHAAADGRRLGAILVEQGAIGEAELQDVLRQQLSLSVQELCRWSSGYFRFEVAPVAPGGEIGVDAEDLVVAGGIATDQLLIEAMTRMDEQAAAAPSALEIASLPLAPALRGEVTHELLRCASSVVARAVLLLVRSDEAHGAGQLGVEAADADTLVRSIRLPLGEPSVVADAVERRETRRGPLDATPANLRLAALLGGASPRESVVVPMLLRQGVGLVLYGDDAGRARPIGDTTALEWALLEAGLGMERDLLDQRVAAFERARGQPPYQTRALPATGAEGDQG